jgi:hypothetical protein
MNNIKDSNIRHYFNSLDERPLKQVVIMIIFTFVLGMTAACIVGYFNPCPASAVCPPGYKKLQGGGMVICKRC